jgi:AcrR family transcriptional regulator
MFTVLTNLNIVNKRERCMPTPREKQRANTLDEIKTIARRQMAEHGAMGVTLRGIAREMDLTVTALYRYYPSYDDLITDLIVDAFHALADALEAGNYGLPQTAFRTRLHRIGLAYRQWVITYPSDFALIYGTPIPNYSAPRERTVPAVQRGLIAIMTPIAQAHHHHAITPIESFRSVPPTVHRYLDELIEDYSFGVPSETLYWGYRCWIRIHGTLMLEVFNHLKPSVGDSVAFYEAELQDMLNSLKIQDLSPP